MFDNVFPDNRAVY